MTWAGPPPTTCDVCGVPITVTFIDGRATVNGAWGFMCPSCHLLDGCGLGPGKGQRYERKGNRWVKTLG